METQIEIPKALRGRLEFGNAKQIAAVKILERKEAEAEEERRRIVSGELRKYEVEIELSGTVTVTVLASSKQEAERMAQEECYPDPDLEIESVTAREIRR